MADVDITASFQAGNVEQGFRKVEQGTQRLQRSTRRSGMAFLEATRALEDFQFAGIRGAANNLPGLAMALGLGTGIAGVTTIAAVGLLHLTKTMEAFSKAVNAGATQAKAFGDTLSKSIGQIVHRRAASALEKELEGIATAVDHLGDANSGLEETNAVNKLVEGLRHQVQLERELAELRGDKQEKAARFQQDAEVERMAAAEYEKAAKSIAEKRTQMERERAIMLEAAVSEDSIAKAETEVAVAKANAAKLKALVDAGGRDLSSMSPTQFVGSKVLENVQKLMAGVGVESMKGETASEAGLRKAKEMLALAEEEAAQKQRALDLVQKRFDTEKKALSQIGEAIKNNADAEQKIIDEAEAARRAAAEAIMRQDAVLFGGGTNDRLVDLSTPILSSQGRAGLAGNEIQTAMQSLQVERDMLRELKALVKLTRTKTTAWA